MCSPSSAGARLVATPHIDAVGWTLNRELNAVDLVSECSSDMPTMQLLIVLVGTVVDVVVRIHVRIRIIVTRGEVDATKIVRGLTGLVEASAPRV
jgi:hypothetical protein